MRWGIKDNCVYDSRDSNFGLRWAWPKATRWEVCSLSGKNLAFLGGYFCSGCRKEHSRCGHALTMEDQKACS